MENWLPSDRLSKNNRTIIFSIHQPRFAIYKLFEHLVLLAKGNIVYQGPCSEALDYFADLGEWVCSARVVNVTTRYIRQTTRVVRPRCARNATSFAPWQAIFAKHTTTQLISSLTSSMRILKLLVQTSALKVRSCVNFCTHVHIMFAFVQGRLSVNFTVAL